MLKKMMLLAVAAAALAVPAAAQAQPLLYETPNIPIPAQAEVTATSTNLVTKSPVGELKCTKVTIHGTVTTNNTEHAEIKPTTTTVEGCNTPITNPSAGTITINANGTGSATPATFVAGGFCHYAGTIPFTYVTNTDTLNVVGANQLTGTPAVPCAQATMSGSFTLETKDGTPIDIR